MVKLRLLANNKCLLRTNKSVCSRFEPHKRRWISERLISLFFPCVSQCLKIFPIFLINSLLFMVEICKKYLQPNLFYDDLSNIFSDPIPLWSIDYMMIIAPWGVIRLTFTIFVSCAHRILLFFIMLANFLRQKQLFEVFCLTQNFTVRHRVTLKTCATNRKQLENFEEYSHALLFSKFKKKASAKTKECLFWNAKPSSAT